MYKRQEGCRARGGWSLQRPCRGKAAASKSGTVSGRRRQTRVVVAGESHTRKEERCLSPCKQRYSAGRCKSMCVQQRPEPAFCIALRRWIRPTSTSHWKNRNKQRQQAPSQQCERYAALNILQSQYKQNQDDDARSQTTTAFNETNKKHYIWINETRCTVNITSILTQLKRWTS